MKIAIEGCCHGELDKIYETISCLEKKEGVKVDLLLCCGDFQAVRNEGDLKCMAVPAKYRTMQTFYKYYSGEKKAPILTVFIGGNHEASNHLQELPYGGWVAPNIYYLGYAGVIRFKGIRIGGLSGIYKSRDFRKGHHEFPPYNPDTLRSVYHIRNIEVFKLKQIRKPIDIFMSHDWPRGIYHYGRTGELLQKKKFLRQEVECNSLGSPAAEELLAHLQPTYWFSAHLHVKFAAVIKHPPKGNADPCVTKFLSLDKCLPKREFLQIIDVPERPGSSESLEYDPEWLAILKGTNALQNTSPQNWNPPEKNLNERWDYGASEADMIQVLEDLSGSLTIPENFSATVAPYDPSKPQPHASPSCGTNPQTTEMCAVLSITDIYAKSGQNQERLRRPESRGDGREEADRDDGCDEDDGQSVGSAEEPSEYLSDISALSNSLNPDEISIECEWDENGEDPDRDAEVPPPPPSEAKEEQLCKVPNAAQSPMVLPTPKYDTATTTTSEAAVPASPNRAEGEEPCEEQEEEEEEEDSPLRNLKRASQETAAPASSGATMRIKRRNQGIYATMEEDEAAD